MEFKFTLRNGKIVFLLAKPANFELLKTLFNETIVNYAHICAYENGLNKSDIVKIEYNEKTIFVKK